MRVIDEIFTSRRDWGMGYEAGFVRRGGVARARSLGTRGAGRGSNRKTRCERA